MCAIICSRLNSTSSGFPVCRTRPVNIHKLRQAMKERDFSCRQAQSLISVRRQKGLMFPENIYILTDRRLKTNLQFLNPPPGRPPHWTTRGSPRATLTSAAEIAIELLRRFLPSPGATTSPSFSFLGLRRGAVFFLWKSSSCLRRRSNSWRRNSANQQRLFESLEDQNVYNLTFTELRLVSTSTKKRNSVLRRGETRAAPAAPD